MAHTNDRAGLAKPLTLAIDIGGGHLKAAVLNASGKMSVDPVRVKTPKPATPEAVVAALISLSRRLGQFDRVSIGFPGVVRPTTGITVLYTFAATPPHGGGYDDMVFAGGAAFLSASHPTLDAKGNSIGPSIVRVALVGHTVEVTPVLSGTPFAKNIPFGTVSQLNLTDPDSMIFTPTGEVLLDD
jgi:ROK family